MRVAVEKLEGVESAEVSLNDGRVRVQLASANRISVAELRQVIRRQGFSPREAVVTLAARIEARDGGLVALAPGGIAYDLVVANEHRQRLSPSQGGSLLVTGEIATDENETTPSTLRVTDVTGGTP